MLTDRVGSVENKIKTGTSADSGYKVCILKATGVVEPEATVAKETGGPGEPAFAGGGEGPGGEQRRPAAAPGSSFVAHALEHPLFERRNAADEAQGGARQRQFHRIFDHRPIHGLQ